MVSDFVHLHLHTDYSLLDGATSFTPPDKKTPAPLPAYLKELGMTACAITDHGFMGGCLDFYNIMNKNAIKPLLGCEMYLAPGSRHDRGKENKEYAHLVLLAKNFEGYQNLCRLMSAAHLEGFYYKARIDKELLRKYNSGLIALTACLGGEIPQALLNDDIKGAHRLTNEYIDLFGRENLFVELMDHDIDDQKKVNKALIPLAQQFGLRTVATNDVHYLKKAHARAHEILLCIGTKSKLADEKRFKFDCDQFYLKSESEMREIDLFKEHPEAIINTRLVAEMCDLFIPTTDNTKALNHYPVYDVADTSFVNQNDYLRDICFRNIPERYGFDPNAPDLTPAQQEVIDRTNFELDTIAHMGFSSYYLVVWDFLDYARRHHIPVGPGRGSGAGSIAAFLCYITDIDPIRYHLLFERFLNPERVSPPDFDIDFCERRRVEVIDYVRNKYGDAAVAQIGTYGTLKPKAAIKDVARVMGFPPVIADAVTKTIPGTPGSHAELFGNDKNSGKPAFPDFMVKYQNDQDVKRIVDEATPLFGLNRNMTIHAAGVIIGDQPLANLVPLARGNGGETITQYAAKPCENLGLLKMDFLGLRTLTILQDAVDLVKETRGIDIDLSNIGFDDPKTYELVGKGDTVAVFQLESGGMRNLCRRLNPTKLEEIIALIALYRPGPMQFIDQYITGQKDPRTVRYAHPLLEPICKETYGILVYQEQVMEAARRVAGYSLGGADILRRAMGKKDAVEMAKQRALFVEGAAKNNNIPEAKANEIFDTLEKFAQYGFNKSHSAAYAVVAYRTAYMKANYPVEFMAAVLTSELAHADKLRFFINECREAGIEIKGPDVNKSLLAFNVDGNVIRFGLAAIKGVGEMCAQGIIEARKADGPFKDLADFCSRVKAGEVTLQNLIRAGAFDSLGAKRSQLLYILPDAIKQGRQLLRDRESGQDSFFDMLGGGQEQDEPMVGLTLPDLPELDDAELLKGENDLLSFWLSGHPLSKHEEILRMYATEKIFDLVGEAAANVEEEGGEENGYTEEAQEMDGQPVRLAGLLRSVQKKITKTGKQMAIIELDDMTGRLECLVFEKLLLSNLGDLAPEGMSGEMRLADFLQSDAQVLVEGFVSLREGSVTIMCERIIPLERTVETLTGEIHLHLYEKSTNMHVPERINELCLNHPGNTRLVLCVKTLDGEIAFIEVPTSRNVRVTPSFIAGVKEILGLDTYRLKPDTKLPEKRRQRPPRPKPEEEPVY